VKFIAAVGVKKRICPRTRIMGERYPEKDGIENTVIGRERIAKIKLLKEFVIYGVRKPCL